jgi:hypothetical protein
VWHSAYNAFRGIQALQHCVLRNQHLQQLHRASSVQDIWEAPFQNVSVMADLDPPRYETANISLWQLGNQFTASAREVMSNHYRMVNGHDAFSNTTSDLRHNRHWYFVVSNGPSVLYEAYKTCMDSLLIRGMEQIAGVNFVSHMHLQTCMCVHSGALKRSGSLASVQWHASVAVLVNGNRPSLQATSC